MSQATRKRPRTPPGLQGPYAMIRDELDEVEELLRAELSSEFRFVDRLAKHGFRLGGKRLRPALVLLSGKACGALGPEHVTLAAAVEMIHTATLIHDDVLDEATIRRHLETVNVRWDNEASVLLGDYLFARAICMVSSLDDSFACRTIAEASRTMCQGELRQIETRGNYDLGEEAYLDVIADKTAALCACCCRLGAYYAGAESQVQEALARFGRDLGVAFQIVDDVLDVLGDEATTGKSLGTDLIKEKPTLPCLRLLSQAGPDERSEIVSLLSSGNHDHRKALKPWLDRFDAISYSRQKSIWFVGRAGQHLAQASDTPAREALKQVADFVVSRKQ